jgi:hypothetical protein
MESEMSEGLIVTLKDRLRERKEGFKEKFKEMAYKTLVKTVGEEMADAIDDWEPSSARRVGPARAKAASHHQGNDGRLTVVIPGEKEQQEDRLRQEIQRLKEMGVHGEHLKSAIMERRQDYPDLKIKFADGRSQAPRGRGLHDRGERARASSYGR